MLQENLLKIYETSFRENREMSALTDYFKGETFSYYEMAKEIAKIHLLFKKAGIKQGDKIALIGRNNPRWCITYMGTITYGAVIVPILQDFTPADIIHIINHSESRLLFLGDNFWDVIEEDQIKQIEAVFSLTNYTSGTTGYSKGVMLTVNNLTSNVMFAATTINTQTGQRYFQKGGRTLSFLPLAHAYGCAFDFLAPLAVGGHITLLGKIPAAKILLEAMAVVKPTIICCVPMILEKVYRKQVLPMLEKGPMSIAMKIPLLNSAIYSVIRKKLMDAFGGNVGIFIVGGAPMNQETESFLMKIKFPITIGYGMTECAPLISFTPDNEFKAGSCGRFLKGLLEVRIDSEDPQRVAGEILVRGEHVMKGYYKNDKDTHKVLDEEGWLHTGDMATMDPDGTLYIRGRSKTMILSGNGQNIYPEEIEDKLNVPRARIAGARRRKRQDQGPRGPRLRTGRGRGRGQGRPAADHAEQPSGTQRAAGRLRADLGHRTLPQRVRKNPETKHQTLSIRTLAVEQIRHRQVTNWILYPKILHSH